jgi:hypothetical protein
LDFTRYEARTIWSDMRIFVGDVDWTEGLYSLKVSHECDFFFPTSATDMISI